MAPAKLIERKISIEDSGMLRLEDYIPVVGKSRIDELMLLSDKLSGKTVLNINSTSLGGGVAEILNRMLPLLKGLGLDARWAVMSASEEFFEVTKKFHNALHGKRQEISSRDFDLFSQTSHELVKNTGLNSDIFFIHDLQPIALVNNKTTSSKWVWRCHIDVSDPNSRVWNFIKNFIFQYDSSVFSSPNFSQRLPIKQFLISPSIDPLSDKNKQLSSETIDSVLDSYGISKKKPIVTQISRFDYLKDPFGVIEAYKRVKKYKDCQLVLAGGTSVDDPESNEVLNKVKEQAKHDKDIHVLLLPSGSDIEINALQRASTVIVQKSLKEGFGLTVAEALWKSKPVVASYVGGIPLQIKHKYSGLLCRSVEGAAFNIKQLLSSPSYAKRLGENGREHIRNNFLLTRHIRDYILLFLSMYHKDDVVYL